MLKCLKNNKGMTLVELIAAAAIFSIIALMMIIGFTTASKIILRSNERSQSSMNMAKEMESTVLNPPVNNKITINILNKSLDGYIIEKGDSNVTYKAFVPKPKS